MSRVLQSERDVVRDRGELTEEITLECRAEIE